MLIKAGTFSKDPAAWGLPRGIAARRGEGPLVLLNDGKWYLDWVCALGQMLLGYDCDFAAAVAGQVPRGAAFSLPHTLEYDVAGLLGHTLTANIPRWNGEKVGVRFCKTGSEAVGMAVRLARAATGRDVVAKTGYHGWFDWAQNTPPAKGVPQVVQRLGVDVPFGSLDALPDNAACVVVEQPPHNPPDGYYTGLRAWCDRHGALLVMDEVVTGLRYAVGGASQLFDVAPDLICMGKALGNGLPVAALVGRYDLMRHFEGASPVFCSSTTWGGAVGLVAANFVLENWTEERVRHLWGVGTALRVGLNNAGWPTHGHGPRTVIRFESPAERAVFIRRMKEGGILMNRPNFANAAHTLDDVEKTVDAARNARRVWDKTDPAAVENLPEVLFADR